MGKNSTDLWVARQVFVYEARSLKVLYQTSISCVGNVEWLDESTYALTYDVGVAVRFEHDLTTLFGS